MQCKLSQINAIIYHRTLGFSKAQAIMYKI